MASSVREFHLYPAVIHHALGAGCHRGRAALQASLVSEPVYQYPGARHADHARIRDPDRDRGE